MIVSPVLAWLPFEKSGALCACIEIFFCSEIMFHSMNFSSIVKKIGGHPVVRSLSWYS